MSYFRYFQFMSSCKWDTISVIEDISKVMIINIIVIISLCAENTCVVTENIFTHLVSPLPEKLV